MNRLLVQTAAFLLALGLPACKPPQGTGSAGGPVPPSPEPTLVFDTSAGAGFYDAPWPSDARRLPGGAPDLTRFPNPGARAFIERARELVHRDVRGASPTGAVYFRFDGPVNPVPEDPMRRLGADSPVLLVEIDRASPSFGRRHPCHVQVTAAKDRFRPEHLVQILPVPGLGLEEGTLHAAIVLRHLGHPGGPRLGRSAVLSDLLAGRTPPIPDGAAWAAALAPLASALPALSIAPDDVAAATVFRTGRPSDALFDQVRRVDSRPALAPVRPLSVRAGYPLYHALGGEWTPPEYQDGLPPFIEQGGRMRVDAAGNPVKVRDGLAPFSISVPRGKMPAGGFPLYFYVHGTGGTSTQVLDRGTRPSPSVPPPLGSGPAEWVAAKGWGACSTALPLAPERMGVLSVDGYIPYNFFNPVAMRDNLVQMVLDLVAFRDLVLALSIDPRLCPGTDASAAPDGRIRFDPRHVVVSGQSLGSYLSGMLAATLGGFEAAVLTGAGGSWVEFPFGPKDPVDLKLMLEHLVYLGDYVPLDRFHPVILLFDLALGPADNTHFVPLLLRRPRLATPPPHVLIVEGWDDHQVPTDLQRALVLASGADMAGPDVGPTSADRIAPILSWGGQRVRSYPLKGNVVAPGWGPRTAGMVRYTMDSVTNEGHFVIYQRPEPRKQLQTFLETLLRDGVPTIPSGE